VSTLLERIRGAAFWPMLQKEFLQMRRDRLTLAMMVVLPAVQLALFGYAIRTEVRHLPTVVLDESRTAESRALVEAIRNTGYFDIAANVRSREEVEQWIRRGGASAALVIPPDYLTALKRGRTATAQMLVDAADPLSSQSAIAGATLAAAAHATTLLPAAVAPPLELRVRPWYNPALRSETYIVPGLVGILLSITMILITSMAVVRERERGTFEQLIVTPIGKTSLMLGKILPFVLVGYTQMTVILTLAKIFFHVPLRGSLVELYLITFGFITANLGIGLLVSTLVRTQAQAMQASFFFLMPNILLSGFMFPRAAMPAPAQWLGLLLPLTYYLQVLRGILLKDVGLDALWKQTIILLAFAAALIALSVRRFSKTIE
jgi:ABC-2 type transport system permease protein